MPLQADAIRAFAMGVNLQTLIQGQRQYRARLEAAGKKNPAAMKASLAADERVQRVGGQALAKAKAQIQATLAALGLP